jgi:hypothetical protein
MAPADLLTFALLVGGFMLLSRLFKWAVERARKQQLEQAPPPAPLPEGALIDATWGSEPQAASWQGATGAELARRMETIATGAAPQQPRHAANALLRSRQDLRHAIVLMTVLGPCRALDPPDGK